MSLMSRKVSESVFDVSSTDDCTLWSEWSDTALNKENWANPKNGPDGLFLDTQLVQLPPSLKPHEWIRAKRLDNLTTPLTVFIADSKYPDLIVNNKHLLHSQFARWFISALTNLQHCGRDGLEISGENGNFIWNGRQQSWRGWMNVYSMNKAGKGAQHRPVINPNGKYVVRLYFLGAWRRILVDDMIPVNEKKLPLLPRTANDQELWPMLLSKALLKLCSLSWMDNQEIVDFHPVACLTGWVCLKLDIGYLSPQDKWDFLRKYADHFEWDEDAADQESREASRSGKDKERRKSKETGRTKKSKDTEHTKKSMDTDDTKRFQKTDRSKKVSSVKALIKPQPVTLFLGLQDMSEVSPETVPELAPCWSHFIYVAQSRDIPLDPKDVKPPLARWKLYRWLKWAICEGIIDPVEYFVPIRSLKVVSPLKKCEESIINKYSTTNVDENVRDNSQDDTRDNNRDNASADKAKTNEASRDKFSEKSKDFHKRVSAELLEDISFWADFNKMEPYIKDVHFFYKLDYFQYSMKLSNRFLLRQPVDQKSEMKKDSKKSSRRSSPAKMALKDPEFVDTYHWPRKMTKTRNEPLYIFTDSLDEKFFLIDFSTFQVSTDITGNDDDKTTNAKIRLKGNRDYLNIEKHNWFRRPEKCCYLISIVTAGTKATVMEIDPGRHLLRVYCRSESGCFLTISSDTMFHVGDKKKMYELMCTESEMVDKMAKHISNSLSSAYQAFGTRRYPEALRIYYNSYLPPIEKQNKINKMFYSQIHDYLIDEQVQLIKKTMPEEEVPDILRSLRIFFVNHTIGLECFTAISMLLKSLKELNVGKNIMEDSKHEDQHSTDEMDGDNKAAVVIQSFFKMITIRKYAQIHDPRHEQHDEVLQNLLKVVELFNYNERESLANQILRNILKHHDKLYDVYFCSRDFEYTLQEQELKGSLTNVKPNQWLPIIRLIVNSRDSETVFAGIDLFVDLPKYSVRVFKNQTGKEILRVVNNVVPHRYTHVNLGYTIFCYGWSEDQASKEIPWSFHIVTMKGQPMFDFLVNEVSLATITTPPVLLIEELSDNYIPNSKNYISKWILRVVQPSVSSFRLRVSYEKVKMALRVTDEEGQVLSQVKGISVVILPMVYLKLRSKSDETVFETKGNIGNDRLEKDHAEENSADEEIGKESRSKDDLTPYRIYHVEALVLDDSWPLTRKEWSLVSEFKVKPTGSLIKTKIPAFPSTARLSKTESLKLKRGSKQSINSVPTLESPYWVLQMVTDAGSELEISQDRTKEKEIARMKEAWAKENPDSLQRGRELREAFIKKHETKPKSLTGSLERKGSSHSEKSLTKRDTLRSLIVNASEISMAHLEERTSKPPSALRRLPPLDLTIYEVKEDEEDKPWVKTEMDEDMLRNIRMMNIIYAQEDYKHFLEDLENLYKQQKHQYQKLYGKYNDSFRVRRSWFSSIYEIRRSYIENARAVAVSNAKSTRKSNKSNNNTKSKKSQKS